MTSPKYLIVNTLQLHTAATNASGVGCSEAFHALTEADNALNGIDRAANGYDHASAEAFHALTDAFNTLPEAVHASSAMDDALFQVDKAPNPTARSPPTASPARLEPASGIETNVEAVAPTNHEPEKERNMRFPTQEPMIAALANDIVNGLVDYADEFPSPPVNADEIREALTNYHELRKTAMAATAIARQSTAAKDEGLETLTDLMKAVLRYAENKTRFNGAKLKHLGWGGRAERTSLEIPGAPRSLEMVGTGEGWILLDWKAPSNGGRVAAYRVEVRPRSEGKWRETGMAIESETILEDQERGIELDYRVVAVNKAGESKPSLSITVLL